MKTSYLVHLVAGLAAAFLTSQAQASITLDLFDPEYAHNGQVSINGYVGASPGAITNLVWNWGDGTTNESAFPATHTYPTNGDYTVEVTAYTDTGESKTETVSVFITNAGGNIDLWLMDPEYGECGAVWIGGDVSTQTGSVTNLVWNWGDGTTNEDYWFAATHTYLTNGDYTVEVTAYADTGESNTATVSVVITNVCAYIDLWLMGPEYGECGAVSINGAVGAQTGYVTNLVWSWGDGTTNEDHWFAAAHSYLTNGDYTVTVTAYADTGESKTVTQQVAVATITPACGAPRLSITLNPQLSTLNVSWPPPAEGWVLEATNALPPVSVGAWPVVDQPYQTNAGTISVTFTNSPPVGNQFFRLHKP